MKTCVLHEASCKYSQDVSHFIKRMINSRRCELDSFLYILEMFVYEASTSSSRSCSLRSDYLSDALFRRCDDMQIYGTTRC
jgi:hypothetical protein